MKLTPEQISEYKFRPSSVARLMAGVKPNLTENQEKTLAGLLVKKDSGKITDKQLTTLGDLIAKRDAKPKLSSGAITYLNEIISELVFNRSKEIYTKYMDKGICVEDKSISIYTKVTGKFFVKNEKRYENNWLRGTPDMVADKIYDIKSSFDWTTFPLMDATIKNKTYYWQLLAYMYLTELKEAELVYVLSDTPEEIVNKELDGLKWKLGYMDTDAVPKDVKVETVSKLIYTAPGLETFCLQSPYVELDWFTDFNAIKEEHRVKVFNLEYDPDAIQSMKTQIILARDYLTGQVIDLMKNF